MPRPMHILNRRVKDLTIKAGRNELRRSGQMDSLSTPMIPTISSVEIIDSGTHVPAVSNFIEIKCTGAMLHKINTLVFQDTLPTVVPWQLLITPAVILDGSVLQFKVIYPIALTAINRFVALYSDAYAAPQFVLVFVDEI